MYALSCKYTIFNFVSYQISQKHISILDTAKQSSRNLAGIPLLRNDNIQWCVTKAWESASVSLTDDHYHTISPGG